MSRRSYERMMAADPAGLNDPLERIDFVVRMHFLQDAGRQRRLAEGLRTALSVRATEQVKACLEAWESDDWDELRRDRHIRDAQYLVRAQVDTLDKYMRDAVRTRAWDTLYMHGKHAENASYRHVEDVREALWTNAMATVDWDRIVEALPVGKCDEQVAEPPHPTQESLYWALVRRQIGAQVLRLDQAKQGPVTTRNAGVEDQEHPSQWSSHDLSTLLGDERRDGTPQARRAVRYALPFAAETPHGISSTLALWAPDTKTPQ